MFQLQPCALGLGRHHIGAEKSYIERHTFYALPQLLRAGIRSDRVE